MSIQENISGLARDIRNSVCSELFDLSGFTEIRVRDLVISAFSTPITAARRGGKLVRSRYDDDLIKWLTTALRENGFVEDKSAAETLDSQGTYKQQHDTGQNLKYVIVFPRLAGGTEKETSEDESLYDTSSPEYILVACELSTFKDLIPVKLNSWRQKKRAIKILQDSLNEFEKIEKKLISGEQLSLQEQRLYDMNPGNTSEKLATLQAEVKNMVDVGLLTASEKEELLISVISNMENISKEIDLSTGSKKSQLEEKRLAIIQRKEFIDRISPIQHRLRYGQEIQKLWVRVHPLLLLEDRGRSMSLTIADLKMIEEKSDLETKISQLEMSSRGWFEDDNDFRMMCDFEASEAKLVLRQRSPPAAKGSNTKISASSNSSGWSTVANSKKTVSKTNIASKKTGNGFAAAFDDDSD